MNTEFSFHELKAADRLPSPSGLALAIMRLVQREDATVKKLTDLVKADPALTARILSFANSAAFGARRPVAAIQDAVIMMGMQAVRNFALGLSIVSRQRNEHCSGFDYGVYWAQALALAVAVAAVTGRERTVAPEESFTLGLLSDIGRLALATAWSDAYSECLRASQGGDLMQLERERFAVDHNELTLILLLDWGLPSILLDSLKLSFESPSGESSRVIRFAQQLTFARRIARFCVAEDSYRAVLLPDLRQDAALHALEGESFDQFIDEVCKQWQAWGKLIDIETDVRMVFPVSRHDPFEALPGLELLLVDDDPMMLARLSKQLASAGHRVSTCRDGESALKLIIENKPQLVITDWRMKPMDGLTLCKTLRGSDLGKNLYLIMLTASESEDALVEAFDAGIDDYVIKPVSLKVLLARVRAGQRILMLQQELEKEKKDIERYSAELAVVNRRLELMANTDILTGLPNRRYALNRLEQEWDSAQRYGRPLSVLMLDLDYFKSINDNLGHDAGDVVLAHAANLLKANARTSDIACRLGGEEFLVIAPNTDAKAALLLAERIRSAIQTEQPKDLALPRPMTVSIGVAGSLGGKPRWNELIKLADQALYKIKAEGRNAVRLASQ